MAGGMCLRARLGQKTWDAGERMRRMRDDGKRARCWAMYFAMWTSRAPIQLRTRMSSGSLELLVLLLFLSRDAGFGGM